MFFRHCSHAACIALLMTSAVVAQSTAKNDPFTAGTPATPSPSKDAPAADPFGDFGGPASGSPRVQAPSGEEKLASLSTLESYRKVHGANSTEAFIRMQMGQPTTQNFVEETLENAVRMVGESRDIPIVIDRKALQEAGMTPDVPVTICLKDVKLRSLLHLMLMNLGLTYAIKDEVLIITSLDAVQKYATVETYSLPKPLSAKSDQVLLALTTTVAPEQWETAGGPYTVAVVDNVLVVRAIEPVHKQVAEFLEKLQAAFEAKH